MSRRGMKMMPAIAGVLLVLGSATLVASPARAVMGLTRELVGSLQERRVEEGLGRRRHDPDRLKSAANVLGVHGRVLGGQREELQEWRLVVAELQELVGRVARAAE